MDRTIGFLGAGNMAEALLRGLIAGKHTAPDKVWASAPRQERLDELAKNFGVRTTRSNLELVRASDVIVLAVKPQILIRVLDEISNALRPGALVISIAAGVPAKAIEARLPAGTRVVRTMPNTPALAMAGATALARGAHAHEEDLAFAKTIFDAVGISVVLDESQLDAVTGLSGSGPAYIFLIIEALSDAGVKMGLSRRNAQLLASQTVLGSAKLLIETNEHPGRLKDMVTSPGGTAITGLHTLESGGLRTCLIDAVEAATTRSRELGRRYAEEG